MADILIEGALKGAASLLAPYAGAIALVCAGMAGAEVWEHAGDLKVAMFDIRGLGPQRDAQHQLAVINATNWRSMKSDRDAWQSAYGKLSGQRQLEAAEAAKTVSEDSDVKTQASSDAFDQGYAAGRAIGHLTCGAQNNAKITPGVSDGASNLQSGGLRGDTDFRAQWEHSAYVPAGTMLPKP